MRCAPRTLGHAARCRVPLLLTLGGGISAIDRAWQAAHCRCVARHGRRFFDVAADVCFGLPLSLYRTFGIEARFGFNRMTAGLFIADLLKGLR